MKIFKRPTSLLTLNFYLDLQNLIVKVGKDAERTNQPTNSIALSQNLLAVAEVIIIITLRAVLSQGNRTMPL